MVLNGATEVAVDEMVADGTFPVKAAVEFSGFSRSELYELMKGGALPYVANGNRRLIPRVALRRLLANRLVVAPRQPEAVNVG